MKLPGTPRDLDSIEAHLARLELWVVDLWAVRTIHVERSNGQYLPNQYGLLDNIRQDVCAIRSCVHAIQKEQNDDQGR